MMAKQAATLHFENTNLRSWIGRPACGATSTNITRSVREFEGATNHCKRCQDWTPTYAITEAEAELALAQGESDDEAAAVAAAPVLTCTARSGCTEPVISRTLQHCKKHDIL